MHRYINPALASASALVLLLCGCGTAPFDTHQGSGTMAGAALVTGRVVGGQQPVAGATLQLYSVGTGGTGSASTPLIANTVTSDGNGSFSITGQYSCTGATQVYLTATGGNAGSGVNASLSLMAALGSCATLQANAASTFININELTTVAAVYALAPFMADTTHVGAQGSNAAGLLNAFTTVSALVSTNSGQVAAAPAGVTLPGTRLNTLADILAACVNTTGAGSSACSVLFGATGATDTIDAGLYIARNPAAPAVTALYTLPSANSSFLPTLTARPNDFTLALNYTSANLQSPYGVAIDAAGNAWLTNEAGNSVTRVSAPSATLSAQTFAVGGLLAPRGISIDRAGNVWVANTGGNTVVELNAGGSVLSAGGYSAGGISTPMGIANDSAGNAWVANFGGNSLTELSPSGAATRTLTSSLALPTAVALDVAGNVAVANAATGTACLFTSGGVLKSCPTDGTLFGPTALAISPTAALTMAGSTTGTTLAGAFSLGSTSGMLNVASPIAGGGLTLPTAVAYDAAGTAWFANTASISAFAGTTAITPGMGYGSLNAPQGIAIDGSGNVWTVNAGDNSVSIFIGQAAPTITPLAAIVGP